MTVITSNERQCDQFGFGNGCVLHPFLGDLLQCSLAAQFFFFKLQNSVPTKLCCGSCPVFSTQECLPGPGCGADGRCREKANAMVVKVFDVRFYERAPH